MAHIYFSSDPTVKTWAESAVQSGFLSPAKTLHGQDLFIIKANLQKGNILKALALIIVGLALVTFAALALTGPLGMSLQTGAMIAIPVFSAVIGICLAVLGIVKSVKALRVREEIRAIEKEFNRQITVCFHTQAQGEPCSSDVVKGLITNTTHAVFHTTAPRDVASIEYEIFSHTITCSDALLDKGTFLSLLARVRLHDREFFRKSAAIA